MAIKNNVQTYIYIYIILYSMRIVIAHALNVIITRAQTFQTFMKNENSNDTTILLHDNVIHSMYYILLFDDADFIIL